MQDLPMFLEQVAASIFLLTAWPQESRTPNHCLPAPVSDSFCRFGKIKGGLAGRILKTWPDCFIFAEVITESAKYL